MVYMSRTYTIMVPVCMNRDVNALCPVLFSLMDRCLSSYACSTCQPTASHSSSQPQAQLLPLYSWMHVTSDHLSELESCIWCVCLSSHSQRSGQRDWQAISSEIHPITVPDSPSRIGLEAVQSLNRLGPANHGSTLANISGSTTSVVVSPHALRRQRRKAAAPMHPTAPRQRRTW